MLLLCSCKKYDTADIFIKNNSGVLIYAIGYTEDYYTDYDEPHHIPKSLRIKIGRSQVKDISCFGHLYTDADSIYIHFFNAIELDKVIESDDFDSESRYADERFYLGCQVYSFGELKGLNNTIEYPSKESPKVGFGSRL